MMELWWYKTKDENMVSAINYNTGCGLLDESIGQLVIVEYVMEENLLQIVSLSIILRSPGQNEGWMWVCCGVKVWNKDMERMANLGKCRSVVSHSTETEYVKVADPTLLLTLRFY